MAAMLDMAFQLLTFFILTFKPSPVEGQLNLRLPPPEPITAMAGQKAGGDASNTNPLQGLTTLVITALANQQGAVRQLAIGQSTMGNITALERKLAEVLSDPGSGFDQVVIQVDSRLRYEELMQLLDVCTRQRLPTGENLSKLSFVELPSGPVPN